MVVTLILIGTELNEKATVVQVNVKQAFVLDADSEKALGYFHKGFTYMTETGCGEWCYFTMGSRTVKMAATDVIQTQTREEVEEVSNSKVSEVMPIVRDLPLRTERTGGAPVIATVFAGQDLPVVSIVEGWAAISLFGQTMYTELPDSLLEKTATVENVLHIENDTPIYANEFFRSEDELAIVHSDRPLAYLEDTATAYVVALGQSKGYIRKTHAQKIEPTMLVDLQLPSEVNGSIIATDEQATMYQTKSLQSAPQLTLLEGHSYPIEGQWEDWYIVRVGGQVGYVPTSEATIYQGIPVLMYHHILPEKDLGKYKDNSTTITREAFEKQMDYLASEEFKVLSKQELLAYLKGELMLPKKSVFITFDDGLLSTKEYAYPVLKERGFQAVQHIISSRKDREEGFQTFDPTAKLQFMTDEEMAELTDVFSYEAHTFNMHILDPDTRTSRLLKANAGELSDDLRQNLEDLPNATAFAYPFGQYKEETIEVLKELNLEMAFTTEEGHAQMGDDVFRIKRFGPTQQTTVEQFAQYVNSMK